MIEIALGILLAWVLISTIDVWLPWLLSGIVVIFVIVCFVIFALIVGILV